MSTYIGHISFRTNERLSRRKKKTIKKRWLKRNQGPLYWSKSVWSARWVSLTFEQGRS